MWLAYPAGVTIGFERGPLRIFQVVATKQLSAGKAPLPPTRADLYQPTVDHPSGRAAQSGSQ